MAADSPTCAAAFAVMCAHAHLPTQERSRLAALLEAKVPPQAPAEEWEDELARAVTLLQFPWQAQ